MDLKCKRKTERRFIFCLIFILSLMFFRVPNTLAAVITYDFTGSTSFYGGSSVSGSFGYDTDAEDQFVSTGTGRYLTGFLNGTITGGTYDGWVFNYSSGIATGDLFVQIAYPLGNRYAFGFNEWIDYSSNSYFSRFLLIDETVPLARTDDLLPLDLNLADYDSAELWVGLSTGGNAYFNITSITKRSASVPEPSTLILLGAGLAGVGLLRRRFKT
jgi:hypothetical protein